MNQFDSEVHAVITGGVFAALLGPFAANLGKLFGGGVDVFPVLDGANFTTHAIVRVAGLTFQVTVDQVTE